MIHLNNTKVIKIKSKDSNNQAIQNMKASNFKTMVNMEKLDKTIHHFN
jgi:hypothetical protein